jgi:hypothetical protein
VDAFEAIRKPRTTFIAEAGRHNMRMTNLPDGPEQQARDAAFVKSALDSNPRLVAPDPAEDDTSNDRRLKDFDPPAVATGTFVPTTRAYLIDYDVYTHVSQEWYSC